MNVIILALLLCLNLSGANPDLLHKPWSARWISASGASPNEYGVFHFRHHLELPSKPEKFLVHVTADNRYQLFVNGHRVAWGPARGDLLHWRYESVDLAAHLHAGQNVLAAVVWNDGPHAAVAQHSHQTGFLLQGDSAAERIADSGAKWKAWRNPAYQVLLPAPNQVSGYYVVPPNEQVDGAAYPWGWESSDFDDASWQPAVAGRNGSPRAAVDGPTRWMLVPRSIPMMEETPQQFHKIRRANGIAAPTGAFTVPPNQKVTLLYDQAHLTTAYPELLVSGGKGARVTLRYAEAMWDPAKREKGHRDQVDGKELRGPHDVFIADGGPKRLYRPLFWRTFRYLEMSVDTAGEPLHIDDFKSVYTGYPFVRKAAFHGDVPGIDQVLDIGWRTARLCAHESYMDCPFYEQLQYAGDTRIQCLVSYYMTGDGRLARNAIEQLDSSRTSEGATYSRAPSALQQYIPPFSLWWIGMVHDYWRYVDDPAFVRSMLPGVRAVLQFFQQHQQANGSLKGLPWWNYVDWVQQWPRGVPPMDNDGDSSVLDLQLLLAYRYAADLEQALGKAGYAQENRAEEKRLRALIAAKYWDSKRGLFADTPSRKQYSQHANALAILAGVRPTGSASLLDRIESDKDLAPVSIYFRYYLMSAMREAGLGDGYISRLEPWRDMIRDGLTTWKESPGPRARSDCHAWGSSPNVEMFRTVLGIDSAGAGFKRVRIEPKLGTLTEAAGTMPHPKGEIDVKYRVKANSMEAEISLPPGVTGEFVWHGMPSPLRSGKQTIRMKASKRS